MYAEVYEWVDQDQTQKTSTTRVAQYKLKEHERQGIFPVVEEATKAWVSQTLSSFSSQESNLLRRGVLTRCRGDYKRPRAATIELEASGWHRWLGALLQE